MDPQPTPPPPPRPPRRWLRRLGWLALAGFLALNVCAFLQAWRMSHYLPQVAASGELRKLSPGEKLKRVLTGIPVQRPQNHQSPAHFGLAAETLTFQAPGGPPLEAWWIPAPAARGVAVLFHGYMAARESMLPEARELHDLGWHTLVVDFRSHGGSPGNVTTIGYVEAVDVVTAWQEARNLAPGKPCVLVGFSMGSAAILRAAGDLGAHPDGLILQAPFDSLLHATRNRLSGFGLPTWPMAEVVLFWGSVQLGMNGFRHEPAHFAQHVTCPTLMLHGDSDTKAKPEEARRIFDALAGPKRMKFFPGIGHSSYVKREPAVWRTEVGTFLNSVEPPASDPGVQPRTAQR